jgi:murein DD-endopeptidase MepM/ murein hydrolase activator NlpD
MGRLARRRVILTALVLITTSMVTPAFAADSGVVPGSATAGALDGPSGTGRAGQALHGLAREMHVARRSRWPVPGAITSGFGPRGSPWSTHVHTGVDIAVPRGTAVVARAGGVVAFAGWRGGYGRAINVDHGHQVQTLYGHLSKINTRAGQKVTAGETIGLTGSSGHSSGPHLHYEVRVNGRPVDPRAAPAVLQGKVA